MSGPGGHPRLFLSPLILQICSMKESGCFYLLYILLPGIKYFIGQGWSIDTPLGSLCWPPLFHVPLIAFLYTLQTPSPEAKLSEGICTLPPAHPQTFNPMQGKIIFLSRGTLHDLALQPHG